MFVVYSPKYLVVLPALSDNTIVEIIFFIAQMLFVFSKE